MFGKFSQENMQGLPTHTYNRPEGPCPINLIATNLIRCTACNQLVPYPQLQSHSEMHLPYKYLHDTAHPKSSNTAMVLKDLLQDTQEQEICVKSFLPDELPAKEHYRRKFSLAEPSTSQASHPAQNWEDLKVNANLSCTQEPDRLDLASRFSEHHETPESHQNLHLKSKVNIKRSVANMGSKQINFCQNQIANHGKYVDGVTKGAKINNCSDGLQSKQKSDLEEYMTRPDQESASQPPTEDPNNHITIHIKSTNQPAPLSQHKITTAYKTGHRFAKKQYHHYPKQTAEYNDTTSRTNHSDNNSRVRRRMMQGYTNGKRSYYVQ